MPLAGAGDDDLDAGAETAMVLPVQLIDAPIRFGEKAGGDVFADQLRRRTHSEPARGGLCGNPLGAAEDFCM
jgi:hypothetical protein